MGSDQHPNAGGRIMKLTRERLFGAPTVARTMMAIGASPSRTRSDELVRAGTTVYVPVYAVHRHEKLWREPERFDPSRFEPDAAKAHDRYTYLPFGGGPRVCIGQNFAQMEAKAILATLLGSFQLRLRPGHIPEPRLRVTLRPTGSMPMRIAVDSGQSSAQEILAKT